MLQPETRKFYSSLLLKATAVVTLLFVILLASAIAYIDYNQKTILASVQSQMNERIKGHLTIGAVQLTVLREFPNLSLTLDNAVVKDSMYQQEIFSAKKIFCRISLFKLLFAKIDVHSVIIENGTFFMRQDSSGYVNVNIFKSKPDTTSAKGDLDLDLNLKKLKIIDLHLSINDNFRNKHYSLTAKDVDGKITRGDTAFDISLKGLIHSDSMLFKAGKGSFIMNKDANVDVKLTFNTAKKVLHIIPSPIIVDEQLYTMSGYFDVGKKPAYMKLVIQDSTVNFDAARTVLSDQIQDKMKDIKVDGPVNVNILIQGDIIPDMPPQVDASFKLNNSHLSAYGVDVSEFTMDGLFMNHVKPGVKNDDPNSALIFNVPHAKVNGVPITAQVKVTDLTALHLTANVSASTPLQELNRSIGTDTSSYRFTGGNGDLQMAYSGSIYYYFDTIKRNFDDSLTGSLKVTDGAFEYSKRNLQVTNINTEINFDKFRLDMKQISCMLNGNAMTLSGGINSLRRVMKGNADVMEGSFELNAPHFDMGKVLVVNKGFKPDTAAAVAPVVASNNINTKPINQTINKITDMLLVNLHFKCDEFVFRQLKANKVEGLVSVSANGMQLKNVGLNTCNGSIKVSGGLNTGNHQDKVDADVQIKNVDMKQFMQNMENFDQETIKDNNITGKLNAQVTFSSPLNSKYGILTDRMQGQMFFSLTNGSLVDFDPLAKVAQKIFPNRDFKNITFAEIKDSVLINGKDITFKRMEISSSVLRLFMQGKYSFDGLIDLSIQFPFNNLSKQQFAGLPKNLGVDSTKTMSSIFLRASGKNNNIKIALDPMARQRLKKELRKGT